jgi:hypothetical protein
LHYILFKLPPSPSCKSNQSGAKEEHC